MTGHVAHAKVTVDATPQQAWQALTDPGEIRKWMAGTTLTTDWQVGSPITWQGEMEGKPYEDKGEVLEVEEARPSLDDALQPADGPGGPARELPHRHLHADRDDGTAAPRVALEQDGNDSQEQADQFSQTGRACSSR